MNGVDANFFESGGTLRPNAPSYVERSADREILHRLLAGEFCYVLTSRQMGKSSLMSRTAAELKRQGALGVVLDLTAVGQNLTPEQWYGGLIMHMGRKVDLEDEVEDYWLGDDKVSPVQRFVTAIRQIILPRFHGPSAASAGACQVAVFIDEIDVVRSLPFTTDEFFAAIRECYNRRGEDPLLCGLTFCLLGVATPAELMRDPYLTPFNIGHRIELRDFTREEARGLAAGLGLPEEEAQRVLDRVLYWTEGHPYLTQRLCQALVCESDGPSEREVDRLCEQLFLSNRARERDDNLLYVRERILRTSLDLGALLRVWQRVHAGEAVRDDETKPLVNALHLAGIVRAVDGLLRVRNRIYEAVFDDEWVKASLPVPRRMAPGSIAVLPFSSRGPGAEHEYLSDGVTEELIHSLGQVPSLKVASRTSAYQFKGRREDVRRIGSQLNVRFVLEGSVAHGMDDAFRISAELVNSSDGYCVWSEGFGELRLPQLGAVLDRITNEVALRLKDDTGAAPAPVAPAGRRRSQNQSAYNCYLKGRHYWNKRSEDSVHRSIRIFEEALREDAEFALAHAALADAYIILGAYSFAAPRVVVPKAAAAARRALELDDQLAQAHCSLAWTLCVHEYDWAQAEDEFRRAIALNPSYATARQWYAINCLTPLGRHEESISMLWQALEVDPLSISISASVGLANHLAGRLTEALEQFTQTVEMDPDFAPGFLFMGWTLEQLGRFDEARRSFERAYEEGGRNPVALASLGHLLGVMGRGAEATEVLSRLAVVARERYVPCSELALVHAGLGQVDEAFQELERALVEKPLRLIYLGVDPRFAALRTDPRCARLLESIGLGV